MSEKLNKISNTDDDSGSENIINRKRKKCKSTYLSSDEEDSSIKSSVNSDQSCHKNSFHLKSQINYNFLASEQTLDMSTPSRKRSRSLSENNFPSSSALSYTNVNKKAPLHGRKSLPIEKNVLPSSKLPDKRISSDYSTRKSFSPRTPIRSSINVSHKSCATDQTPYSPVVNNYRHKRLKTALPYYNHSDLVTFKSKEGFIDSHCHLDFLFQRQDFNGSFSAYQDKHKDTFPECYKGCLAIFCNPYSFNKRYLWEDYLVEKNVWASFGCHPHNAKDYNDDVEKFLCLALEHPKVRALGEIGLDYSNRNYCHRSLQHEAFRRQLKIAIKRKLPLVIHCREAHDDGMAIMKEIVPKDYFIHLHCFTDTWELASKWLQEFPNLFIGITNVVTFPSAEDVHEVAKKIPLSRLLLETDAPYFIPRSLQRENREIKFSHPGMAIHVAAQIAALKEGVPLELVLHTTRQNTRKIYNI